MMSPSTALPPSLARELAAAESAATKLIKNPQTIRSCDVSFKALVKGLFDANLVPPSSLSSSARKPAAKRRGLIVDGFDDEQIFAQMDDANGRSLEGSWKKRVKKSEKALAAEQAAAEEAAAAEQAAAAAAAEQAAGASDEDSDLDEDALDDSEEEEEESPMAEEELSGGDVRPAAAPLPKKRGLAARESSEDALLDEILSKQQSKTEKKALKKQKTAVSSLLGEESSSDEDAGVKAVGKKSSKKASEKLVLGGKEDAPKARSFADLADTDSEEEGARAKKFGRTEVDDEFFSLREMEAFGKEAEELHYGGEGDDEGDEGDDDEVYKMFFSDDVEDGGDLMYDDFFGAAKKSAAGAAVEKKVVAEKHAEKSAEKSLVLEEPASKGLCAEEESDGDSAEDSEEEEDELDEDLPDDFARFEEQLAELERQSEGKKGSKSSKKASSKERVEGDAEARMRRRIAAMEEASDDESESEASTCSWNSDQEREANGDMPGGGHVPGSGFDDDVDIETIEDAEDRALELAVRKLGRSKKYLPGGVLSKKELEEESSDSDPEGLGEGLGDDLEGLEEGLDGGELSDDEEEEEEEEDVDSDDSDARVEPKRNLVQTLTAPRGGPGPAAEATLPLPKDGEEEDAANSEDSDGANSSPFTPSLARRDRRLVEAEAECERMEEELLHKKHWSMTGEAAAKDRERNSLLAMHLDLPMTHMQSKRAMDDAIAAGQEVEDASDAEDGAGANQPLKFDIELIARRRIADALFDDVVRKADTRPATKKEDDDSTAETLNFQKSRVGLGDIYAQQYEEEVFGKLSKENEKVSKEKLLCKELFGQLMYKLDQLTNAHFVPKPMAIGGVNTSVDSIELEEAVPVTMMGADRKAPEEIRAHQRTIRAHSELDTDERKAVRNSKKQQRRKDTERLLVTGEKTLADVKERKEKLDAKNKIQKEKKAGKGKVKDRVKKLKNAELLEQAAERVAGVTSGKTSRKLEMKEWKEKTEGGGKKKRGKF